MDEMGGMVEPALGDEPRGQAPRVPPPTKGGLVQGMSRAMKTTSTVTGDGAGAAAAQAALACGLVTTALTAASIEAADPAG